MVTSLDAVVIRREDHLSEDIGDETLMMRIATGRYFSLEGPGQAVWRAIDGVTPVSGIVMALRQRFDVDREACEAETLLFLNELIEEELIEVRNPDPQDARS